MGRGSNVLMKRGGDQTGARVQAQAWELYDFLRLQGHAVVACSLKLLSNQPPDNSTKCRGGIG